MTKRGYLTGAEYKAIRTTLGFTQQEAKDFHKVQNLRTIQRWENGESWVSEIACDKITKLFTLINSQIDESVRQIEECADKYGDFEVVLIIYPDACYKKFVVGIGDLPNNVHKAMIMRIFTEVKEKNIECGIVEFNPQDYFTYLASNGLQDSQDVRSAWAINYRDRILQ